MLSVPADVLIDDRARRIGCHDGADRICPHVGVNLP